MAAAWHVVCSEPSQESLLAAGLTGRGFIAYCPTITSRIPYRNRYRETRKPLFPGYVFARFDAVTDPWQRIFSIPGEAGLLMIGDRPAPVKDREIDDVKRTVQRIAEGKPAFPVGVGDQVEVDDPLWRSHLGTIEELDDAGRVVVLMRLFERDVRVHATVGKVRVA